MAARSTAVRYFGEHGVLGKASQTKASAVMADKTWVAPEELMQAANDMADHGESLLTAHRSSHGEASAAQSGWVGSSAGALSGLLDNWETATTDHVGRIGNHSCGMHFTAADFAFNEQQNKQRLDEVGRAATGGSPHMQ
jgi:uncharacterized protein YukE